MFGIERQLFTFSTSTHDQMSRIGCVLGMGERARAEFCTPPLLYERHRETVSTTHIQRDRHRWALLATATSFQQIFR